MHKLKIALQASFIMNWIENFLLPHLILMNYEELYKNQMSVFLLLPLACGFLAKALLTNCLQSFYDAWCFTRLLWNVELARNGIKVEREFTTAHNNDFHVDSLRRACFYVFSAGSKMWKADNQTCKAGRDGKSPWLPRVLLSTKRSI